MARKKFGVKAGFRKPSLKISLKTRTTVKYKSRLKKAINPLYGKKGICVYCILFTSVSSV